MTGIGDRFERESGVAPGPVGIVAFAWHPVGDYEQAIRLWPELAESDRVAGPDGPLPHPQYCRAMQQQLVQYAQPGMPQYAAHLAATGDSGLIPWPPGRNEPCWCASGHKYKKCCAAPASVDTEPNR